MMKQQCKDNQCTLAIPWLWFFLGIMTFCATSTTTFATATVEQSQQPFTMTWSIAPSSLTPNGKDFLIANHTLASHVFDPLFNLDSSGTPRPILVKSFQVESPTKWLFTLKSGVKFHDGSELSSADVMATFNRINQDGIDNPYREMIADLQFEAISPNQFRITTKMPDPELPNRLIFFFIINKKFEYATEEQFESGELMIGTGPYQFVSQENLEHFRFKAFANYHRKPAYLKQVNIVVEADPQKSLQDYINGKTDFIQNVTPNMAKEALIQRQTNIVNVTGDILYSLYLDTYNDQPPNIRDYKGQPMNHNPLKDRRVRQAISLALSRTKLIETIFGDSKGATATGQLIPPWNPAAHNRIQTPRQDIPQAQKLLAQAGYPNGFQLDIYDRKTQLAWTNAIAAMLKKVGIHVTSKPLEPNVFLQKAYDHEFSISPIAEKILSLRSALNDSIFSKSANNTGRYTNLEIDRLIIAANQEFNNIRRTRQYRYIMELALEDQAIIPLFFLNQLWLIRPDLVFLPAGERLMEAYSIHPINEE